MTPLISGHTFIDSEFSGLDFNDKRLSDRVKKVAMTINESPNISFPNMVKGNRAELKALYRFFQNHKVTDQSVLQTHYKNTISRCQECKGNILLVTDTVLVEPSKYAMFEGLQCRSSKSKHENKIVVHYMIAVDSKSGQVQGITDLLILKGDYVNGEFIENQAELWAIVLKNTLQRFQEGDFNSGDRKLIYVADREADDLALFKLNIEYGVHFVIRGKYNRSLDNDLYSKISDLAGTEIKRGKPYEIEVFENGKRRKATVQRYTYPEIVPHTFRKKENRTQSKLDEISVGIVIVVEDNPPPNCKKVHWFLLTSLPTNGVKLSGEIVEIYKKRWLIEELNKCAKTGVLLEDRQFTDFDHMAPAIGIIFVIAWRLLTIRNVSEKDESRPIDDFFIGEELNYLRKNLDIEETEHTLKNAIDYIAVLGGFLHTYPRPGWMVLWRGWIKFSLMAHGYAFYAKYETKGQ